MAVDINRKIIVDGLLKVEKSGFSNLVLSALLDNNKLTNQDRAFITKVFYGTIERKLTLNYILQKQMGKPIAKLDKEVVAIMQSALYQALYMSSVPDFAAINQAVNLCYTYKKTSAKGLVNAVLRKSVKFNINDEIFSSLEEKLSITYSVSVDILKIIMRDYPDNYIDILKSMYDTPELMITVNTTKISINDYKILLKNNKIIFEETPVNNSLSLSYKGGITNIPGFKEGYFFVQGITSNYCIKASDIQQNDNVLDVCSAPGGKTFSAAISLNNSGTITSCDPNDNRLKLIKQGAEKLGFDNINTLVNLGEIYNSDLKEYNVIICDVPCSGIGIIAKKPDLRYKDLSDIQNLCKLQYEILSTSSKYLAENGKLIYSTCTINVDENQKIINKFLSENSNFSLVQQNCDIKGAINNDNMVTFLPNLTKTDGFFIAVLKKMC